MKKINFNSTSRLLLLISIISTICFFCLASYIFSHDLTSVQQRIHDLISSIYSPFSNQLFILFTKSANPFPILIFTGAICLLCLSFKKYKAAFLYLFTVLVLTLGNVALKHHYMRQRPTFEHLIEESGYSFPSGHAMMSFGLAILSSYLLYQYCHKRSLARLLSFLCFLYTCLIGFSRIYVSVHFLSDVLGGYLGATAIVCLILSLYSSIVPYANCQQKTGNR